MNDITEASHNEVAPDNEVPLKVPVNFGISLRGFADPECAKQFGSTLGLYIREFSRQIDLSRLDGVTVAFDYDQALLDLDRGYETSHQLTASKETVLGIAMTPGVLREGEHRSHMVFNANYLLALEDLENPMFPTSLHILAHECAHVAVSAAYDRSFPDVLLRRRQASLIEAIRTDVTLACWDEFSACRLSDRWGTDPLPGYLETFLLALEDARKQANASIRLYRRHADLDRMLMEVGGIYGNLMKFASYFAGALAGRESSVHDVEEARDALEGHWFSPFYDRLVAALQTLTERYGEWGAEAEFSMLGDIIIDLLENGGLQIEEFPNGSAYVNVPFTLETA